MRESEPGELEHRQDDVADEKLRLWIVAVEAGNELLAERHYESVRSLYELGARPNWDAAGLPGPSAFFGWVSRNLKPKRVEVLKVRLILEDDEVMTKKGPKKLPKSRFPGFRGEPSQLPGMGPKPLTSP